MEKLSCIILAGGESKRFGENKAFFNFNGKSFIERAAETALKFNGDIIISAREKESAERYGNELKKKLNINPPVIADDKNCGFIGPLRGIYSCIKHIKGKYLLIMECDAPLFNFSAANELIKKMEKEKVNAVVPLWPDSTVEPLLGIYNTKKTAVILDMLNDYALNLGKNFPFMDSVNISRFLPSVYYYNILDIIRKNTDLKIEFFMNINSKEDIENYLAGKINSYKKKYAKSVKIRKANRFFDVKNPSGKPSGILANALYYWWIYSKTGNYIYLKKSYGFFKKDADKYYEGGLDFMGGKLIKTVRCHAGAFSREICK
jgi:molybdopterin-guanine dinucleotide biosynthesis protein A